MKEPPFRLRWTVVVALIVAPTAQALFIGPSLVPTERILKNTEAYLEKNPDSAQGHYIKGRIHYLTFVNRVSLVQGWPVVMAPAEPAGKDGLPGVAPSWMIHGGDILNLARMTEAMDRAGRKFDQARKREEFHKAFQAELKKLQAEEWRPPELTTGEALDHAVLAAKAFDTAIRLEPKNGLFHLGKASLFEQVFDFLADEKTAVTTREPFTGLSHEKVIGLYQKAHLASIEKDLTLKALPASGIVSLVSHESAKAVIRLAEAHPEAATKVEGFDLPTVRSSLKQLEQIPQWVLTPILLAQKPSVTLADLVRKNFTVEFDVDGDGRKEKLDSWPAPSAGILVWDARGTGQVKSGAQWFGTFGFRMIWEHGYQALDAFDDSRDGWLRGAELDGLALWFDRDSDAVSDPGEVRPTTDCGVTAIAVRHETESDGILSHPRGVRWQGSGPATPSVDWVFRVVR